MKTLSLKLQRIAAVVAILAAPLPALAVNGPTVSTWIPGTDVVETVGSVSTTRQPGPYNARDVYKLFVTAVAGKDLRLVVTGPAGEKVDQFNQRRDNGLYAVFGSVDAGSIKLDFQTAPTGTTTWTTVGTKTLTVAPQRTLIYDTEVPINVWYASDNWNGYGNASTISQANLELTLDRDFNDLKNRGFTSVTYIWQPVKYFSTIFANASQYGLKIQIYMDKANTYTRSLAKNLSHHNAPLLEMEDKLNLDGINTDVGGGVLMKNHPALWAYYLEEEELLDTADAVALAAMMCKSLDPNHSGISAQPSHSTSEATFIGKVSFADFNISESYPFGTNTPPSDFSKFLPDFGWNLGQISVPDYLDWIQSKDPRRYVENAMQAHSGIGFYRVPSANELKAQMLISAARGSRPLTWFVYNKFASNGEGMTGVTRAVTPTLTGVTAANAKMATWMPTYKNLVYDPNGAFVPYAQVAATSGNLYFNDLETTGVFGTTSLTTAQAVSPTKSGLRPASIGNTLSTVGTPASGAGTALDLVNRYNPLKYRVWVNDLGNANMTYRLAARFVKDDGTYPVVYGSYINIGSGWQELVLDLTAYSTNPDYSRIQDLWFQAYSSGTYVDHYIDDVKLEYTKPAYTPKYGLNGGVVGAFQHEVTADRYLIAVNTDCVTARTVAVNNVRNKTGGLATTAKDVVSGTIYNLSGGNLSIPSVPPGDGALLQVDPSGGGGVTTLYSNNMESTATYGGTLVTTPAPHGGTKSEQRPANGSGYWSNINKTLPAGTVSSAFYRLWVFDNNNATQSYRLGVTFEKPDLTSITDSMSVYVAAGSAWTQVNYDITSLVNLRKSQGYTKIKSILIWGYNTGTYVPYYLDDVVVEYQ